MRNWKRPKFDETQRDFGGFITTDHYGQRVVLGMSSICLGFTPDEKTEGVDPMTNPGSSCLWLGCHKVEAKSNYRGVMHLDRDHVDWLIEQLVHWRKTGTLKTDK